MWLFSTILNLFVKAINHDCPLDHLIMPPLFCLAWLFLHTELSRVTKTSRKCETGSLNAQERLIRNHFTRETVRLGHGHILLCRVTPPSDINGLFRRAAVFLLWESIQRSSTLQPRSNDGESREK